MVKQIGLNRLLLFAVILACVACAGLGGVFLLSTQSLVRSSADLNKSTIRDLGQVNELLARISSAHVAISALLQESDIDVLEKRVAEMKASAESLALLLKECGRSCDTLSSIFGRYVTETNSVIEAYLVGRKGEAFENYISKLNPLFNSIVAESKTLAEQVKSGVSRQIASSEEQARFFTKSLVSLLAVFCACFLVGGFFFRRSVSGLLLEVTGTLSDVSSEVRAAGQKMEVASQGLTTGTSETAKSFEETVGSLDAISKMISSNAEHAQDAAKHSSESSEAAKSGESEICQLLQTISELSKSSKQMEEIIDVIEGIAFQTNLLALNAAVEAARAGDQGKGFAVVAEAVRMLAQKSSSAAKDISGLIKQNTARIQKGVENANEGGEALRKIVAAVQRVEELNASIAVASREQAEGIARISQSVSEIDKTTQVNASTAEEVSASAEELAVSSESLQSVSFELKSIVLGIDQASAVSTEGATTKPIPLAERHTDPYRRAV